MRILARLAEAIFGAAAQLDEDGFPSPIAIACDDCGIDLPKGSPVLLNNLGELVHVECPDRPGRPR